VAGRLTSQVARWKLERGSRIESLEQWLQSRTVFTAIFAQIRLASFNLAGLFLVLVWASSPLGSQSVQRLLGSTLQVNETATSAQYFDTNAPSGFAINTAITAGSDLTARSWRPIINSLYSVALLAPNETRMTPTDLWGNLKIPLLSSHHPTASGSEWSEIPTDRPTVYSALAGLPIPKLPSGNNTFNIESSYIQLSCSPPTSRAGFNQTAIQPLPSNQNNQSIVPGNDTLYGYRFNSTLECPQGGCGDNTGATWWIALKGLFINPNWTNSAWHSTRFNTNWTFAAKLTSPAVFANETEITAPQATLVLGTSEKIRPPFRAQDTEGLVTCLVAQTYVESRVSCVSSSSSSSSSGGLNPQKPTCHITAQRPSQQPNNPPTNITHLSFFEVFRGISRTMPFATGFQSIGTVQDPSIYYLATESATHFLSANSSGSFSTQQSMLVGIPAEKISVRLTQMVNTYLLLSQTIPSSGPSSPSTSTSTSGGGSGGGGSTEQNFFTVGPERLVTGPGTLSNLVELYTVNWLWAGFFLAASLVLVSCAVTGMVVAHIAVIPDILGYVSSSVRDSKYISLPMGTGGMDGMQLTRRLKGEEVRYGVVRGESLGILWEGYVGRVKRGGSYW